MGVLPLHPDLLENDAEEDPELVSIIIQEAFEKPLLLDEKRKGVINTLHNYFNMNRVEAVSKSENTKRQNRTSCLNFNS